MIKRVLRQMVVGPKSISFLVCAAIALQAGTGNTRPKSHYSRSQIQMMVIEEAHKVGVPCSLALAVAHAESNFDPAAQSNKGARGVMQVMPATSRAVYNVSPEILWNPRVNIVIGLDYLKYLLERYRGRSDLALSFYNGGSRVDRYGRHRPRVIPYTRKYVMKVTNLRLHYARRLRGGNFFSR